MYFNSLPLVLLSFHAFWISLIYSAPTIKAGNLLHERTPIFTRESSTQSLYQRDGLNHLVRRKIPSEIENWDLYKAWDKATESVHFDIPDNTPIGFQNGQTKDNYFFETTTSEDVLERKYLRLLPTNRLGQGSFGAVYKAFYTVLNTKDGRSTTIDAAVKIGWREPGDLIQGANLQKSIVSNYIVDVYDVFYDKIEREAFQIMEEAKEDLVDYSEKNEVSEGFFKRILVGVYDIHSKGIMHRDLKPDNILIIENIPKIADFDMAIKAETSKQFHVGTLGYLAPEVLRLEEYSSKADIFALGMMWIDIYSPQLWEQNGLILLWKELVIAKSQDNVKAILTERLDGSYWSTKKLNLLSKVVCEAGQRIDIQTFIEEFVKSN